VTVSTLVVADASDAGWPPTEERCAREDFLNQVGKYRHTFAALLAAGTSLLELEGDERWYFERRLEGMERLDEGGFNLGVGRTGPAEDRMGVEWVSPFYVGSRSRR
jgi:hypothetical protein